MPGVWVRGSVVDSEIAEPAGDSGESAMSRRPADRTGYLVAALWMLALGWLFATSAWELPDNELPPVAAQGGGR